MYLLDTNVVSELRRAKPHGAVVTRNAEDFGGYDIALLDPFTFSGGK
jgi:predicted nucleic acid-binding protein